MTIAELIRCLQSFNADDVLVCMASDAECNSIHEIAQVAIGKAGGVGADFDWTDCEEDWQEGDADAVCILPV